MTDITNSIYDHLSWWAWNWPKKSFPREPSMWPSASDKRGTQIEFICYLCRSIVTMCLLDAMQLEVLTICTRTLVTPLRRAKERKFLLSFSIDLTPGWSSILLGTIRTLDKDSLKTSYVPVRGIPLWLAHSLSAWEAQPSIFCPSSPTAAICC